MLIELILSEIIRVKILSGILYSMYVVCICCSLHFDQILLHYCTVHSDKNFLLININYLYCHCNEHYSRSKLMFYHLKNRRCVS